MNHGAKSASNFPSTLRPAVRGKASARAAAPIAGAALAILVITSLTACAQRPGLHAYKEGFNRYQIVAVELGPAAEQPDRARLRQKALWKAATVTRENGRRYFRLVAPPAGADTTPPPSTPAYSHGNEHLAESIARLAGTILVAVFDSSRAEAEAAPNRAELRLYIELAAPDQSPDPDPALYDAEVVIGETSHLIEPPTLGGE